MTGIIAKEIIVRCLLFKICVKVRMAFVKLSLAGRLCGRLHNKVRTVLNVIPLLPHMLILLNTLSNKKKNTWHTITFRIRKRRKVSVYKIKINA